MTPEEGAPEAPQLADPAEKLILIVDDDESILDLVEMVIKKEGFKTERAADGGEALRKVEATTPDLIICDMMLPGKSGYEVVRELQAAGAGSVPIIIITGRSIDHKNVQMLRQEPNVREFMQKPIRPPLLSSTVHAILKTRPPEIDRFQSRGPMSSSW